MGKKINETLEHIKESVCKFYLDNKLECDFHYSNAENKKIGEIYEKIEEQRVIQQLLSQSSVVILTANKYEKNILHHNVFNLEHQKIKKFEINLFPQHETKGETYAYSFKWQDYTILHIEAQKTGSYTIGGSADIVRYVINNKYIFPTAIISLGICFGADEKKLKLGDIIISKKIYPYFIGTKINEDDYLVEDDNMFRISSGLNAKIKSVIDENGFKEQKTKVYFGNYVTGEAVVSNLKIRDTFVKITKQEIIAGEMEGYGLFKECNSATKAIPCIVIKSICDWAVAKNFDTKSTFERLCDGDIIVSIAEQKTLKDRIQAYASFQAYSALDILLSKHIFVRSIYERISEFIVNTREKVVHANVLRKEIYKLAEGLVIDDVFVLTIIQCLINNGIISHDETILSGNINCLNEKIWRYTFPVERRIRDVKDKTLD